MTRDTNAYGFADVLQLYVLSLCYCGLSHRNGGLSRYKTVLDLELPLAVSPLRSCTVVTHMVGDE